MINLNISKKDVDERNKRMSTKQALSMQATIERAMGNRAPQNPGVVNVNPQSTANGYGRSV